MKKAIQNKRFPNGRAATADRSLLLIFCIAVFNVMGITSIVPALPVFSSQLHIASGQAGLLLSFYALPSVFILPFTGWLADRYGRKKVIVPSLILFGLAGGSCAFITSFQQLLTARFFQGIGAASLPALNNALISDRYQGERRTQIMGYNTGVLATGNVLFPVLGGALAALGWHFPFLLYWLALPVAGWVWVYLDDWGRPHKKEYYWQQIKRSVSKRLFVILFASGSAFILLFGAYFTYFPFLLSTRFHLASNAIGLLITAMPACMLLTALQMKRLSKKTGLYQLLIYAFLLYAAALFLIYFANAIFILVVASMLMGAAHGLLLPSGFSLIASYTSEDVKGVFMSLNEMSISIGQAAGPFLAGIIFFHFQIRHLFLLAACAGLAVSMLLFLLAGSRLSNALNKITQL